MIFDTYNLKCRDDVQNVDLISHCDIKIRHAKTFISE